MTGLDSLLAQHGSGLILALSCLLGVGTLAVLLGRSPLHRQRVAELTLAAALLASGLLLLPLPRPGLGWLTTGGVEQEPAPITGPSTTTPLSLPVVQLVPWKQVVPRTNGVTDEVPVTSVFAGAPRLLAQLFLLGAAGFAAHLLLSLVLLRRTLRKAAEAPTWVKRLAYGSEPSDTPRILLASGIMRPFCCGLGRGTIVLPAQLAQPALRTRVEVVLAHERAHLCLRHPRARLLASLVAPFLYWHPLYWWLVRELRRCSELLADDMAAGRLDKRRYVAELLELAESCGRVPAAQALGLGAFGTRKDFLVRMETLLMRRTRLSTRSSALQVATRSLCAILLLGSVSLAWGRPPQDGLPTQDAEPESTRNVVRDFTTAIDTIRQVKVLQDHTLQSSTVAQLPETQPGIVATFHFVDPRALGEFFVQCYDAGLAVRMLDLGPPDPETGRRSGHASVHGVNAGSLDFLMEFGVPGLDLTLITVDGKGFPGAKLPRNPLATRVDRMQQELTDLQDQIARLEALRAEFRGRRAGVSYPRDPASGLPPARDRLLLDPDTGILIEQDRLPDRLLVDPTTRNQIEQARLLVLDRLLVDPATRNQIEQARLLDRLLVDPASGLPGKRNRLVLDTVSGNPVTIEGVVVNTLGGDQSLIAISSGSNQGVEVGMLFEVFRDSTYKGRVKIVTVSEDICIGTIELQAEGTKIEQGDKATTRL